MRSVCIFDDDDDGGIKTIFGFNGLGWMDGLDWIINYKRQ